MATAKQQKQASGKKKSNAKSAVKSAPKGATPKKNSALKSSKKPLKVPSKATPAKKSTATKATKPVKKVVAAPVKPKTKPVKSDPVSKKKSAPVKKPAAAPQKGAVSSQKKQDSKPVLNKKPASKAIPTTQAKVPGPKSSPPLKSKGTPSAGKSPVKTVVTSRQQKPPAKAVPPKAASVQNPLPTKKVEQKTTAKANVKPTSSKSVSADKKGKGDSPEPLQIKAEKAIREMEETMDLSKLRPRIQAGSSAPKPLIKHQQAPLPKLPEPTNTAKVKFQLEFEFRSSPKILFTSLSDSSGLAGWFADEVHTKDDVYTFSWEGGDSQAKLIAVRDLQLVRFQWLEDIADGTYFQFEIKEDDITSDVALVITDFALPGEKETNIRLWESQVQKLRMLLGSL